MRRKPNGYGSISRLGGNRARPWMVRVTIYDVDGSARQVPIGYAETEEKANILLAQYNNNPWDTDRETITLQKLYERWLEIKAPQLSASNRNRCRAAIKHCTKYYGMRYRSIKSYHMQDCVDACSLSQSTKGAIKNLFVHLDAFAFEIDLIDKMYSQLVTIPPIPETTRTPFTRAQIDALWEIQDTPWVDTVLIYLYTGFRVSELLTMPVTNVDINGWHFRGGVKTAAGKDRIVPIHERIKPLVCDRLAYANELGSGLFLCAPDGARITADRYRGLWRDVMDKIGADKTPHEARHTFETNLDNAGANRRCVDLLMGHKSADVGNRVYNHKTLDQLRDTVALLD